MNTLNCEYIREVYPDVLNGTADASITPAVRAHIAQCTACREEAAVIEMVRGAQPVVPQGLHGRIIEAHQSQVKARPSYARPLALAATLAAAVIGGSLLFESAEVSPPDAPLVQELGFVTVEAAMVSGTTSLQDLTVEELEQLLGEIES